MIETQEALVKTSNLKVALIEVKPQKNDYIAKEMVDFDLTIGAVLDWAMKDKNTLVVITADHETGGFALDSGSMSNRTIKGMFTSKEHTGTMVPVFAYGPGADEFVTAAGHGSAGSWGVFHGGVLFM